SGGNAQMGTGADGSRRGRPNHLRCRCCFSPPREEPRPRYARQPSNHRGHLFKHLLSARQLWQPTEVRKRTGCSVSPEQMRAFGGEPSLDHGRQTICSPRRALCWVFAPWVRTKGGMVTL